MAEEEAERSRLHVVIEPENRETALFLIRIDDGDGEECTVLSLEFENLNAARDLLALYQNRGHIDAMEAAALLATLRENSNLPEEGSAEDVSISRLSVDVMRFIGLSPEEIRQHLRDLECDAEDIARVMEPPFTVVGVGVTVTPEEELEMTKAMSSTPALPGWTIDPGALLDNYTPGDGISE